MACRVLGACRVRQLLCSSVVAPRFVASSTTSFATKRRALHSTALLQKVIPFNLPDIGEGIAEVEVLQWHVKVGDKVAQFDKLLEVQSDKATVDITSRYDGIVKALKYKKGDMAKTGTALLEIEVEGEGGAEDTTAASAAAPAPAPAAASPASAAESEAESHARGLAAPAVRRIAKESGIPLASVRGTGKDGRITKEDILRHMGEVPSAAGAAAPPAPASAPAAAAAAATPVHAPLPARLPVGTPPADVRVPLRGFSRAMVKSMTQAWAAPHFGYCEEVVMDPLMSARAQLKALAEERGVKVTYLPFLVKAASLALSTHPTLNAQLSADGTEVIQKGAHNIGIAMDTPRGLVVPVLHGVQDRSILELAQEMSRLQAAASQGKLTEQDLSGCTFTLSNIGTIGGTYAAPVIPTGTAAIGALGKISKMPRYASTLPGGAGGQGAGKGAGGSEDPLVPAHIMQVSWSADHRFVDGATMARFTRTWKSMIESPAVMLVQLR